MYYIGLIRSNSMGLSDLIRSLTDRFLLLVIDDLDTFLSGCQRNVLIVKKNYEELVKLSVYLQGEVDAERIKSLEKQEESLIKSKGSFWGLFSLSWHL